VQLRLLGPLTLEGKDGPIALGGKKQRSLLAVLAVHANRAVSEDRLIDAMWGEDAPRTALRTLNSYISRLRQALHGTDLRIESTPGGYVLRVAADAVDATEVANLLARARAESDADIRIARLADAAALWRGEPLGEFASEPWAIAEAARLTELRQVVIEERIDALLAAGRHAGIGLFYLRLAAPEVPSALTFGL
jgi:DNA-binding SARP family transcriptional activator